MTQKRMRRAIGVIVIGLCLLGAGLLLPAIEASRPVGGSDDITYLPTAGSVKMMSLGYSGLMADIYWTRTVQYFGRRVNVAGARFELLAPLLDTATQLDPQLMPAYEFGSVFLAEDPPRGAGRPEEAVALLERGIAANPAEWRLWYELGFVHYFNRHDYAAARQAFESGSKVPGAHPWMKQLAARMAEHGGDLVTARFLWAKAYEEATDPRIRANALALLRELDHETAISTTSASSPVAEAAKAAKTVQ